MYRVGFGDCFLLSFGDVASNGGTCSHLLIDCGVHTQGDLHTLPRILENIKQESKGFLSLVIATHAHRDHISGFDPSLNGFSGIRVSEVWLPWIENLNDPTARKLVRKRTALAEALEQHIRAAGISGPAVGIVQNALGNEAALGALRNGLNGARVRYLKAGASFLDTTEIKGLSVQILAPPTDQHFLSVMNPPVGDRFLRVGRTGKAVAANPIAPFPDHWITDQQLPEMPLKAAERKKLAKMLNSGEDLAFTLDSVLNNTSIVSLMSYQGKNLLFPGDAQYGNWKSWIATPEGESILGSLHFLKVAHHGSHNATPRSALERTSEKAFVAMISTQDTPWPSIPYEKMLAALRKKAKSVVRSDSIPVEGAERIPRDRRFAATTGFELGPFWCDYFL